MKLKSRLIFISIIILLFAIALLFLTATKISAQEDILTATKISAKEDIDLAEEKNEEVSPQEAFLNYLQKQIESLPADEKQEFKQQFSDNPGQAFLEIIDKMKSSNHLNAASEQLS